MKNTIMIKKNYEFNRLFLKGNCYFEKHIKIYILNNTGKSNKLAIAVGKKNANSVQRHRIRRLIKENYRIMENNMCFGKNIMIVWNKNANIEETNFKVIGEEMKNIFEKIGVIKKEND